MLSPTRRLTALAVAALLLAGCAAQDNRRRESTPDTAEGFPVTVTNCGRELSFNEPPSRVITAYHPTFETLVDLGVHERIAARVNFSENGPGGFLPGHLEIYNSIKEISDNIDLPSKEVLLAEDPDLVVAISFNDFRAASGQATIEELESAGIPVFITGGWCDAQGVRDARISNIFDDLQNLGKIFGVPDAAAELAAEFQNLIDDVQTRVSGREAVRVLATDGGAGPVNAYGGSGLFHQMIEIAGGQNVLDEIDEDYTEVSAERVATSDPEALLVVDYDVLFGEARPSARAKADQVLALVPDSPAARQERFLAVPAAATHSGAGNIRAIPDIARFLHPDAFDQ
ncbi:MAG: ABC transporter substrate-binding protein [Actinomycetota bacterium]